MKTRKTIEKKASLYPPETQLRLSEQVFQRRKEEVFHWDLL